MWGFIDESGDQVIEPRFDLADIFSEGLCAVTLNERDFCIDRQGKMVLGEDFDVGRFENGVASAKVDGLYGLVDHNGNFIIPPKFRDVIGTFKEGLCDIEIDGLYGYIDITGEFVIQPQFAYTKAFSHGLAIVRFPTSLDLWYIDHTGRPVLGPYKNADDFRDGLALVKDSAGPAYIDPEGSVRYRFDPKMEPFNDFSLGLAGAFRLNESGERMGMGYINKNGDWVIDPTYDHAYAFEPSGLAKVENGERMGMIDTAGRIVIPIEYDSIDTWPALMSTLSASCISASKEEKSGFIDRNGDVVIALRYESALPFSEGLAAILVDS